MAKFKQEILDKIKKDPDLFALVATEMNVLPVSLPIILDRNGNTLNKYSVVAAVANHLGVDPDTLVEAEDKANTEA